MTAAFLAVGSVLIFEGLVFALAPRRLEDVMALIARLSLENRRLIGLATVAVGVGLLWIARLLGM